MSGLICEIYRSTYRSDLCLCDKFNRVTVVASPDFPDFTGPFEPEDDRPAVVVVKRKLRWGIYLTAYLLNAKGRPRELPCGGSFIYTSDSRFKDISEYPVPLHDYIGG